MHTIKNISSFRLAVGDKYLEPQEEMRISSLEPVKNYFKLNYIIDITPNMVIIKNKTNKNDLKVNNKFIDPKLKETLLESLFNYYLNKDLGKIDLNLLKWFYKNINATSIVNDDILNLLDDVNDFEELTEVLLNNIYSELIDRYLSD